MDSIIYNPFPDVGGFRRSFNLWNNRWPAIIFHPQKSNPKSIGIFHHWPTQLQEVSLIKHPQTPKSKPPLIFGFTSHLPRHKVDFPVISITAQNKVSTNLFYLITSSNRNKSSLKNIRREAEQTWLCHSNSASHVKLSPFPTRKLLPNFVHQEREMTNSFPLRKNLKTEVSVQILSDRDIQVPTLRIRKSIANSLREEHWRFIQVYSLPRNSSKERWSYLSLALVDNSL